MGYLTRSFGALVLSTTLLIQNINSYAESPRPSAPYKPRESPNLVSIPITQDNSTNRVNQTTQNNPKILTSTYFCKKCRKYHTYNSDNYQKESRRDNSIGSQINNAIGKDFEKMIGGDMIPVGRIPPGGLDSLEGIVNIINILPGNKDKSQKQPNQNYSKENTSNSSETKK